MKKCSIYLMEILSQMSFLSFHQLNMFIQKHNTKFEDHVGDITSLCVSLCVCTRVCLQVCVMCMEVRGHFPCHSLGTVYLLLEGPSLARVFTKGTRPANRECQLFRLYLLSHCHDGTKLGFLCGVLGIKCRSSCCQDKSVTDRAISPAPWR